MASFFKIAIRNFIQGPTTDPYPFGETFLPERYRGIVSFDKDKCIGCSTCEHVCPTNAIRVRENKDGNGVTFSYWMNTCSYCGNCAFFCPTNAVKQSNDFHTASTQDKKYKLTIEEKIPYATCANCEAKLKPANEKILKRAYSEISNRERHKVSLCPKCRRMEKFNRMYL